MKAWILSFGLLCCSALALAEHPPLESAKVISQQIGMYNGGSALMPLGGGLVDVPITRRTNLLVVETATHRAALSEVGRHFLLLSANQTISYYRDGNWVIVLDSENKKHKYAVVGLQTLPQNDGSK